MLQSRNNITSCHHVGSIYDYNPANSKYPGPLVPKSAQNQEWEEKRPDAEKLGFESAERMRWVKSYNRPKEKKQNKKHTNHLNSHHGESCNSRADKMSGYISELKKFKSPKSSYSNRSAKNFYKSKRRMFLKNEKFFDKI